ncbi:MAG: sigma-54 dependent transcriptional regulator [Planctomycetota bacterium]|nr:sigma-54 dependent transcriptional regulator [Planctomycetota bacterium]
MPIRILKDPPSPEGRLFLTSGFSGDFYAAVGELPLYIEEETDPAEAMARAHELTCGVAVIGMNMGKVNGLSMLDVMLAADPDLQVIISTHETSPKVIVEAMRRGAFDYVIEPHDVPEVVAVIRRAVVRRKVLEDARAVRQSVERARLFGGIVAASDAMRRACVEARKAAAASCPVLLRGESGTGKELLARAIHESGPRAGGPFVAVNCAAIPDSLLESELFGHERGAFTGAEARHVGLFEKAHGGTLFLDEIGATTPHFQARLLRAIETGEIRRVGGERDIRLDVRVLSAANVPLERLVVEGRFREDLFYRLNVLSIHIPPLRERREDIPLLAQHFLDRAAMETGGKAVALSPDAIRALEAYHFPGNVRELRNMIERAVIMGRGGIVDVGDLPPAVSGRKGSLVANGTRIPPGAGAADAGAGRNLPLPERIRAFERQLIEDALAKHGWNVSAAAKELGIERTTLAKKIARLGIPGRGG